MKPTLCCVREKFQIDIMHVKLLTMAFVVFFFDSNAGLHFRFARYYVYLVWTFVGTKMHISNSISVNTIYFLSKLFIVYPNFDRKVFTSSVTAITH